MPKDIMSENKNVPAEQVMGILSREFASATKIWTDQLNAALIAAQTQPPGDLKLFINTVNLYLAAFQKGIQTDDGLLYRLREVQGHSGMRYLGLTGIGANKKTRGFKNTNFRLLMFQ